MDHTYQSTFTIIWIPTKELYCSEDAPLPPLSFQIYCFLPRTPHAVISTPFLARCTSEVNIFFYFVHFWLVFHYSMYLLHFFFSATLFSFVGPKLFCYFYSYLTARCHWWEVPLVFHWSRFEIQLVPICHQLKIFMVFFSLSRQVLC
jgi:hypothetical protein